MANITYGFWYKTLRLSEFFERGMNNTLDFKEYTRNTMKTRSDWPDQEAVDAVNEIWDAHKEDIFEIHPWIKEN